MNKLIKASDIAELLNVSKRHVQERITKQRGFPQAYVINSKTRRWDEAEVFEWLKTTKTKQVGRPRNEF